MSQSKLHVRDQGKTLTTISQIPVRDLGINGEGVGKAENGLTLFIPGALPGETVTCQYQPTSQKYAKATLTEIEVRSEHRIDPPCIYFGSCGGCQLQHLAYQAQCDWKQANIENQLLRIAKITTKVSQFVNNRTPFGYRNKAQFPLSKKAIGFYTLNSHQIVDIKTCAVNHPKIDEVYNLIRPLIQKSGLSFYQEDTHQGLLRHLLLRYSKTKDKVWVTLVVNADKPPSIKSILTGLTETDLCGGISLNFNTHKGNTILGNTTQTVWGEPSFIEEISGLNFEFSPTAFAQIHWEQAQALYQFVMSQVPTSTNEVIWDLYSGVGVIALLIAKQAKTVLGIDSVETAIENAQENAKNNGITNATFLTRNLEDDWTADLPDSTAPTTIILDPPRKGCSPAVLNAIQTFLPKTIVYVSCNPATLARDLKTLHDMGYITQNVTAFDMFSQTTHVETVATLKLASK